VVLKEKSNSIEIVGVKENYTRVKILAKQVIEFTLVLSEELMCWLRGRFGASSPLVSSVIYVKGVNLMGSKTIPRKIPTNDSFDKLHPQKKRKLHSKRVENKYEPVHNSDILDHFL
jgi:hypothetical protein